MFHILANIKRLTQEIKIIELKINSEDDIKSIINSPIITEDGNLIRLYNFKPKGDFYQSTSTSQAIGEVFSF